MQKATLPSFSPTSSCLEVVDLGQARFLRVLHAPSGLLGITTRAAIIKSKDSGKKPHHVGEGIFIGDTNRNVKISRWHDITFAASNLIPHPMKMGTYSFCPH